MADDMSTTDSGFSLGGLFGGINDTFSQLGKTYLNIEGVKAQTGALQAQAQYNALTGYNPSFTTNPNAQPLTAAQIAALQAQQFGGVGGVSTSMLLLGGVALLAVVLLLK